MTSRATYEVEGLPADRVMIGQLWPLLLAAALGLVPFTVMSTFLVPIAQDAGSPVEVIGGFRGLGGVAALVLGASAAPVVDRLPRNRIAGMALSLLAIGCLLSVVSAAAAWVVFCLLIGAGTSLLNPALSAMAADRYSDEAASGRAATMVASTTTLTAVLAAPVLAAPALLWGWQGDMLAAAGICLVLGLLLWRTVDVRSADTGQRPGYLDAFRTSRRVPGAAVLIGISTVRTTCFMGQLAYVAAFYDAEHDLSPGWFSLVWTLSGVAFFCGNWWAGRFLAREDGPRQAPRLAAAGAALAGLAVAALFCLPWLPVALVGTALVAVGHALVAAAVVTLLVRRAGRVRGTVMSLNGSGQSLGVFLGAALVGATLGLGGWRAVGVVLAAVMLLCAAAAMTLRESSRRAEPGARDADA